jgi:hypothetical protein
VLPNQVTGAMYDRVLVNLLQVSLEHVSVHEPKHTRFMHDGETPNFLGIVTYLPNQLMGKQWIG